ncbi:hypothetical protein D0860_03756 [Hortaea werneckii]|uniref:Uncharacterized protein n=1 Tax=Hortaea werneckii TaxID=91943 RepID=A0A3M7HBZ5_HORWE|nr:hypothetical protein D0860_03756 [Hortaea werneckii]
MPQERILRFPRTDSPGEHVLVNVTTAGSKPLDIKLVATEAEHVYPTVLRDSAVKSLQASNYGGDLDEWKSILRQVFLQEKDEAPAQTLFEGLETVAAINGSSLNLTFRKNIKGITQRLGSLSITQDDEAEEVSPFDWCFTAVGQTDDLRLQLETLQASVSSHSSQVAKLNQQLDDLVKAKKDHEDELLKKFAALLNTKKLKIRDQQRLLAGAKIPKDAAEAVRDARDSDVASGRRASGARRQKRKANSSAEPESADAETASENEDDDALREQEQTPQQTDEETQDEGSEDGFDAPPPPSQPGKRGSNGKDRDANVDTTKAQGDEKDDSVPPPRRELPFQKKSVGGGKTASTTQPSKSTAQQDEEADDDEETDDEL